MKKWFSSRLVLVILLILALCLGNLVYTGITRRPSPLHAVLGVVLTPVQKGLSFGANRIGGMIDYAVDHEKLEAENEALRGRVRELEQTERDATLALAENDRLRAMLGMQARGRKFEMEVSEVIARNMGDYRSVLTLDKGSLAGIAENDCVITADGMVGYVTSVAPTYCEVTTVLDPDMQMGALITRTREITVAEGDYALMEEGFLKLSYLKKDADLIVGDTVETSGGGGLFPKGLMIGTIERILPESHGVSNFAVLRPFVDVATVKHVFIVKDFTVTD